VSRAILLAGWHGVTLASLLRPGCGRIPPAKLLLFVVVMSPTTVHAISQAQQRPRAARAASITALVCSTGVVLLATGLVEGIAN
jgi:hypothetical protein